MITKRWKLELSNTVAPERARSQEKSNLLFLFLLVGAVWLWPDRALVRSRSRPDVGALQHSNTPARSFEDHHQVTA